MEMMTQNLDLKSVQGLKRVPSSSLRLVDFLAEVTFNSHLPSGQGSKKCESCMPKGQAGIQVFFESWCLPLTWTNQLVHSLEKSYGKPKSGKFFSGFALLVAQISLIFTKKRV